MTVQLQNQFVDPVIVATSPTLNGSDGVTVRNVTPQQFEVRLHEWDCEAIYTTESLSWIAVESGHHRLADGTQIEGGIRTTNVCGDATVDIADVSRALDETPVIASTINTWNGATSGAHGTLPSLQSAVISLWWKMSAMTATPLRILAIAMTVGSGDINDVKWNAAPHERSTTNGLISIFLKTSMEHRPPSTSNLNSAVTALRCASQVSTRAAFARGFTSPAPTAVTMRLTQPRSSASWRLIVAKQSVAALAAVSNEGDMSRRLWTMAAE